MVRKTRNLTMMLAALLCLASCQDQQAQYEPHRSQGAVHFQVGMEGTESKAVYRGDAESGIQPIDWQVGDTLGIYCAAAKEDKYAAYSVTSVSPSGSVSVGEIAPVGNPLVWGTGEHVFYATYPEKDKGGIVKGLSGATVTAELASTQAVTGTIAKSGTAWNAAPDLKNMLMVSKREYSTVGEDVSLDFTALTTALQFTVKNDTGAELELVEVSLISGNKKESAPAINGAFTVNLSSWSTPAEIDLGAKKITYTKQYPIVSAVTSTDDVAKRTVKIAVGTSASPLKLAVNDSFTFTFFVAPTANFDDLTFKFTKKDNSWMSTRLGYTNGTGLLFPRFMKSKVEGILLPKGAQWTVKYDPDVVPWNGESQAIDPMAELSTDPVVTSWDTGENEDLELEEEDPYNGHEYVEIGGLKWATMNVGANSPKDYGWYFFWAGTTGYVPTEISGENCKWVSVKDGSELSGGFDLKSTPYHTGINSSTGWTKYVPSDKSSCWSGTGSPDNKLVLDPEDDAARVNWGGSWRMPTSAEFQALYDATKWTWNSTDKGYYITKKGEDLSADKSNALLFFPAAGYGVNASLDYAGSDGYYWSSTLYSSDPRSAYYLYFYGSDVDPQNYGDRYYGQSVRAVSD